MHANTLLFFPSPSHVSTVTLLLHSLGPNVSAAPTLRRSTALHRPANSASSSVPSTGRTREGERWPIAHACFYYSSTQTGCVLSRCMCVMWFTPLLTKQLLVAVEFHVIFFHTMEVNGYQTVSLPALSKNYFVQQKKETPTGLEQIEDE